MGVHIKNTEDAGMKKKKIKFVILSPICNSFCHFYICLSSIFRHIFIMYISTIENEFILSMFIKTTYEQCPMLACIILHLHS